MAKKFSCHTLYCVRCYIADCLNICLSFNIFALAVSKIINFSPLGDRLFVEIIVFPLFCL